LAAISPLLSSKDSLDESKHSPDPKTAKQLPNGAYASEVYHFPNILRRSRVFFLRDLLLNETAGRHGDQDPGQVVTV